MIYSIRLTITHLYNQPAANGRHMVRVVPRMIPGRQVLRTHVLDIAPEPEAHRQAYDFFGNSATTCTHTEPHSELAITLSCHVEMAPPQPWRDQSPGVEALRREWQALACGAKAAFGISR